jgi:hypothetical protein
MLDWITIVIEAVGVVILLMWIVIPIREFRQILQIVKHKPHALPDAAEDDPRRGFPVATDEPPRREDGPRG